MFCKIYRLLKNANKKFYEWLLYSNLIAGRQKNINPRISNMQKKKNDNNN